MEPVNDKYYFDEQAADTAVRFIETYCRHISGKWANPRDSEGRPQDTRVKLADWQKDEIIRPLFGWKKKKDGNRRYTTLYVEIPKKNGKSFLSSAIMLLFLYMDREPGSELYIACPVSKDQAASLLLEPARAMIEKDATLQSRARIMGTKNYTKSILVGDAFLKPLTREAAASEGIKPQAAFIDETHVFKDAGVIENLEKSMIIRTQPLVCYTTTAGDDMGGVGYEKHEYYKNVKEGLIDDESALVVIYGADPDDDPFSEDTWRKANPMWDIAINQEQFKKEAAKAKESAASLNAFKRYHLNIWTAAAVGFISDYDWTSSGRPIDIETLKGKECIVSFDLGGTSDFTAITALFKEGDEYTSLNWFYIPENPGQEATKDKERYYAQWVAEGYITEMPGRTRDDDMVVDKILQLFEDYDVQMVAYDKHQATNVANQLVNNGIPESQVLACPAGGIRVSEATNALEEAVKGKKFNHLGNPVLRWMNSNVEIVYRQGVAFPNKGKYRHKIDGIMTNIYGFYAYIETGKGNSGSYLEHSDAILL